MDLSEDELRAAIAGDERRPGRADSRRMREARGKAAGRGRRRVEVPRFVRVLVAAGVAAGALAVIDVPGLVGGLSDDGAPSAGERAESVAEVAVLRPAGVTTAEVLESADAVWSEAFSGLGLTYHAPERAPFETAVGDCAGGAAPAAYCAGDRAIYAEMGARATPDASFRIAHEVGHHIQALLGTLEGAPAPGQDLQADCLAGVWARHDGVMGGTLTPETLEADGARVAAFARGYDSGDILTCETLL